MDPPRKRCSGCGEDKPLTDYYRDSRTKDGLYYRCKLCHKASVDRSDRRSINYRRWDQRVRGDGMTSPEYELLTEATQCAICGDEGPLVIDHDRPTGAVRGVLCARCTKGIGWFRDDPVRLLHAAAYLRSPYVEAGPSFLRRVDITPTQPGLSAEPRNGGLLRTARDVRAS